MTNSAIEHYKSVYRIARSKTLEELQDLEAMRAFLPQWHHTYWSLTNEEKDSVRDWLYRQKEQSDDFWHAQELISRGIFPSREAIDTLKATRIREQMFRRIYTR